MALTQRALEKAGLLDDEKVEDETDACSMEALGDGPPRAYGQDIPAPPTELRDSNNQADGNSSVRGFDVRRRQVFDGSVTHNTAPTPASKATIHRRAMQKAAQNAKEAADIAERHSKTKKEKVESAKKVVREAIEIMEKAEASAIKAAKNAEEARKIEAETNRRLEEAERIETVEERRK